MIALALQAAAAFNLVCTGTLVDTDHPGKVRWTSVYRIDLNRGRWCSAECRLSFPIVESTPEMITLSRINGPNMTGLAVIYRESGMLWDRMTGESDLNWEVRAQCEHAPFTGLPQHRF